jgi:hypothetical protein
MRKTGFAKVPPAQHVGFAVEDNHEEYSSGRVNRPQTGFQKALKYGFVWVL